jgi:hypothetical protein
VAKWSRIAGLTAELRSIRRELTAMAGSERIERSSAAAREWATTR